MKEIEHDEVKETNLQENKTCKCFDTYSEYAKTLRSWFIGFGIGGPVLMIGNKEIISKVMDSPFANFIIGGFFVGISCQIFLALINKYINWANYNYEIKKTQNKRSKLFEWLGARIEIDFALDCSTVISFSIALYNLYKCIIIKVSS